MIPGVPGFFVLGMVLVFHWNPFWTFLWLMNIFWWNTYLRRWLFKWLRLHYMDPYILFINAPFQYISTLTMFWYVISSVLVFQRILFGKSFGWWTFLGEMLRMIDKDHKSSRCSLYWFKQSHIKSLRFFNIMVFGFKYSYNFLDVILSWFLNKILDNPLADEHILVKCLLKDNFSRYCASWNKAISSLGFFTMMDNESTLVYLESSEEWWR